MRVLPLLFGLPLLAMAQSAPKAAKSGAQPEGFHELALGDAAPAFELVGIDEERYTLKNFDDAKVLVVAFLSNHCPTSQAIEGRLKQFVSDFAPKGVRVVAINPNDPAALRPDELGYSKYNDSFPEMQRHAAEQGFNFPYLFDGENQKTALAYGCLATPHVFVFDAGRKLRYQGRFDDSRFADPATVTAPDARRAVEDLLAGRPVAVPETRPHGCSTKWIDKRAQVAADQEKWQTTPVEVGLIDARGVAELRRNATKKVRLFNVFATWCGPCVEEFPELVATQRKFALRDFEFIAISLNEPDEIAEVKQFLEEQNAIVPDRLKASLKAEGRQGNAYVFKGASQDELIAALDPEWPGPIPHTLVVAPGGEVIFRHNGEIEGEELRAKILEHLGRYYVPEK
jgi:thiol-disulfide isomerase/thioredoxin